MFIAEICALLSHCPSPTSRCFLRETDCDKVSSYPGGVEIQLVTLKVAETRVNISLCMGLPQEKYDTVMFVF